MALTNLESLVLRLVAGVNVGTNPVRIGMDQGAAKTPANSSPCDPKSYRGQLLGRHLHDSMADADERAGRSDDGLQGLLLSRGLASSAGGSVLFGQSLTSEPAGFTGDWRALTAAIPAGGPRHRGRPAAHRASIASAVDNPRADQARSEPAAGAFTASTRGERKR